MAEGVLWKHNRGRDCKEERGGGKHVMLITTQEVTVLSVVEVGKVIMDEEKTRFSIRNRIPSSKS
jgi:hypothetical protein